MGNSNTTGNTPFGASTTAVEIGYGHNLTNKNIIVTGASSGIGIETAYTFALYGGNVIFGARNKEKSLIVIDEIIKRIKIEKPEVTPKISYLPLELSSLESVRNFVKLYKEKYDTLHYLINNAGIMSIPTREDTDEKFESQVGVCHVGHFLLTKLLTDTLIKSAPSRVVILSSKAHILASPEFFTRHDFETVPYSPLVAYGNAKTLNYLHAQEFNKRYASKGVTAYSVHPGGIFTGLQTTVSWPIWIYWKIISPFLFKSVQQGAATTMFCALKNEATPGSYHQDCKPIAIQEPVFSISQDGALASKMWDLTEELIEKHCKTSKN